MPVVSRRSAAAVRRGDDERAGCRPAAAWSIRASRGLRDPARRPRLSFGPAGRRRESSAGTGPQVQCRRLGRCRSGRSLGGCRVPAAGRSAPGARLGSCWRRLASGSPSRCQLRPRSSLRAGRRPSCLVLRRPGSSSPSTPSCRRRRLSRRRPSGDRSTGSDSATGSAVADGRCSCRRRRRPSSSAGASAAAKPSIAVATSASGPPKQRPASCPCAPARQLVRAAEQAGSVAVCASRSSSSGIANWSRPRARLLGHADRRPRHAVLGAQRR